MSELTLVEAQEILKGLPMIAEDDPRIEGIKEGEIDIVEYGNNFYLLWLSLREDSSSDIAQVYANIAREIEGWEDFMQEEAEVINEILRILDEVWRPVRVVGAVATKFLRARDFESYDMLEATTGHPVGSLTAANFFAWDVLGDALKDVGGRMDAHGIDQKQFWG